MPLLDYVNFQYMQSKAAETMMFSGQRLACVIDHDVFGGEVKMFTPSEVFPCGMYTIRQAERPNFTGTDIDMDVRARIPPAAFALFGPLDRFRVVSPSPQHFSGDYEVAGFGFVGISAVVIELMRVGE